MYTTSEPSTSSATSSEFLPAPALFFEPTSRNFGARWYGQRGFGGVLEDFGGLEDGGPTKWIPQYNLAHFWKRRIPPHPVGLIEPLVPPRSRGPDDVNRLPGHFSYRENEYEMYNRNLLASRFFPTNSEENSGILNIWTVNERSKRHYLEGFHVEISTKGRPISETLQSSLERKLKMVPPVKNEENSEIFCETLPKRHRQPLLELRTSSWSSETSTDLFLRSPNLLQILRIPKEEEDDIRSQPQIPIFNTAVKNYQESSLIQGKLAVVDFGGRVWLGNFSENFQKTARKIDPDPDEIYQNVCFSDHPMVLGISGMFQLDLVDIRSPTSSRRLWKSSEYSSRLHKEALYVQEKPPCPALIRHVAKVPASSNNFLMMSDFSLVLVDDRFPGKAVLEVRHGFPSGGHQMIVMDRPVSDTENGGEVFTVISLEQTPILSSGVSMTKIYRHSSGIWSSVDAFHSIGEPAHFNNTVRRGKYAEDIRIIDEPTRALSLVRVSDGNSLLLRQTDDGAIWWQNLVNDGEISERRIVKEERKSVERIVEQMRDEEDWRREGERPVYSDQMDEKIKEEVKSRSSIVHIEIGGVNQKIISKCALRAANAHRKAVHLHLEEQRIPKKLEVFELDDQNSVMSKIVLDTWEASERKMEEAANL